MLYLGRPKGPASAKHASLTSCPGSLLGGYCRSGVCGQRGQLLVRFRATAPAAIRGLHIYTFVADTEVCLVPSAAVLLFDGTRIVGDNGRVAAVARLHFKIQVSDFLGSQHWREDLSRLGRACRNRHAHL